MSPLETFRFQLGGRNVWGRHLRYLLTMHLRESPVPLNVRELVALCQAEGVVFDRRPSKVVSDALRWEIGHGRVRRLRRGVYTSSQTPRSTVHWIRTRVEILRAHLRKLVQAESAPLTQVPAVGWARPTLI